ncbi:MAG: RNA polymerase factor sigma-54 [Deltaproteobacteria bacterium]|nr:RNA polymerase factor sigma-54 [Deltaproteobacteria bacterium]
MALEIKQSMKLGQSLVVTPQLQQAIKLLQLSRLELTNLIQKELTENPCLEEEEEESETQRLEAEEESHGEQHEKAKEEDKGHEHAMDEVGNKDGELKEPSNFDWENYVSSYNAPEKGVGRGQDSEDLPSFENTLRKTETLQDYLYWQLGLSNIGGEEHKIAEEIIGNINDDGYLQATLEEMAALLPTTPDKVEAVLKKVQEFDPAGVAARDLKECLLLQCKSLGGDESELVAKVIENHLGDLERHNYKQIAKSLGIPVERVAEIAKFMQQLDPKPGRGHSSEQPQYITPDVHVIKIGNDYVVTLNEDGLPKLNISPLYRRAIMAGETVGAQAKDYIQDKLRQALWLIKSIHQRQRTLYRVTKSIVKFQKEFLDKGTTSLKPMVLKDVAEDIGMHESTISRVTTNKYVHTPRGLFELKYFFNSGLGSSINSDGVAPEVVKEYLQKMVSGESPENPLSDQEITAALKNQYNIDIARRTVAKYREVLGISPSSRRKRHL